MSAIKSMIIEKAKSCTTNEERLRFQMIKDLFSDDEDLQQIPSWLPEIPELTL